MTTGDGGGSDDVVHEGQVAVIHFVGRVAEGSSEGEVFDTTDVDVAMDEGIYHDYRDYKPLEFRVGKGKVLEALDEAVVGMSPGDVKTVEASPEEAYGERDPDRVVEYPRSGFDDEEQEELEEDSLVGLDDGTTGWIVELNEDTVTVDYNHELSGRRVEFEIRLLGVHGEPGDESARSWEKKKGSPRDVEDSADGAN